MKKIITTSVLAAALAVAGTAHAATVTCRPGAFGGVDRGAFPSVGFLRAINLPRRTDGYAPRCLVADSIGGLVQVGYERRHGRLPTRVYPRGARWDGGVWRLRYELRQGEYNPDEHAVATKVGHPRQHVTMDLGS
jgi:hypothetical protein